MNTYVRSECAAFRKTTEAHGGLSNMAAGYPIRINDVDVKTSEALYQALRFPHLPEVQRQIIDQASPMIAKNKGKPFRDQTRPDWEAVKVPLMRWCLRVKLARNPVRFKGTLLETGTRTIVEESHKDRYWGAVVTPEGILLGDNVLGDLLTELREYARTAPYEELTKHPAPPVEGCLLYGKAIEAKG